MKTIKLVLNNERKQGRISSFAVGMINGHLFVTAYKDGREMNLYEDEKLVVYNDKVIGEYDNMNKAVNSMLHCL